jgi:DNA polymerase
MNKEEIMNKDDNNSLPPGNSLPLSRGVERPVQVPKPNEGPRECRRCDLWRHATQAVVGEGPPNSAIMLVGEQPGDEEDRRGHPFVGPAGRVLESAMTEASIERSQVFLTNAVKHFKWEPRGKRRLHKRPDVREIKACYVWLDQEILKVKPRVIVALGATALRALIETPLSIDAARREHLSHTYGARVLATYHPSAILRADQGRADELRITLIRDLRRAREAAARKPVP